jgi:hypothetical protein
MSRRVTNPDKEKRRRCLAVPPLCSQSTDYIVGVFMFMYRNSSTAALVSGLRLVIPS